MISALKLKEERDGYHGYDNNRKSRGNTGSACFRGGKVAHFIALCPDKKGNGSRNGVMGCKSFEGRKTPKSKEFNTVL